MEEPRKAGSYTVLHAIQIGDKVVEYIINDIQALINFIEEMNGNK